MKHDAVELEMTILTAIVVDFRNNEKEEKLPLVLDMTFLEENKMFQK